ncbi:MAG: four helix bundle protein [Nitrospirae bacterium]|nr:four helix bundle protein [Nitrospirota bacterium]
MQKQESQGDGKKQDLRTRSKPFALQVIRIFSRLPKTPEARILGRQLLRSGTSVGAHYCEAKRARSDAEFVSKIEGGLQELEETAYWLELLAESRIAPEAELVDLQREADELLSILVSCVKTVKNRKGRG